MKKVKIKLQVIFSIAAMGLLISLSFGSMIIKAQTQETYKILSVKSEIGEGKDKELNVLLESGQMKIAQLTLRNCTTLNVHKVDVPILIQCLAGEGELIINDNEKSESIKLISGITVSIEANIFHDVVASPAVSILLIKFPKE